MRPGGRANLVLWLITVALLTGAAHAADGRQPYKRMLDDPLTFSGPADAALDPQSLPAVNIGLFAPDPQSAGIGRELFRGVTLAIEQANHQGGYRGVPYQLVRRWADSPWAAGSKEMIRLAYEDGVLAVISGLDGSSNIGQQVAAKAYLPVVAPIAADSSLTHARVPWIFQLPPQDDIQARVLLDGCPHTTAAHPIGLISAATHDGRMQAASVRRAMQRLNLVPRFDFTLPTEHRDWAAVASRVEQNAPAYLVLILPAPVIVDMLQALADAGVDCPVGLPWVPGLNAARAQTFYPGSLTMVEPFVVQSENRRYHRFRDDYHTRFGQAPSFTAAYGYDAAQIIITGLARAGLTRKGLRQALAALSPYQGVSGTVQWDRGGANRGGRPATRSLAHR